MPKKKWNIKNRNFNCPRTGDIGHLLPDQREKQDKWETSFAELRNQVLQQEQVAARELTTFQEETTRKLRLYQRALQAERDKSVWQKLFAGKKRARGEWPVNTSGYPRYWGQRSGRPANQTNNHRTPLQSENQNKNCFYAL